ncbi:N-acetylneuraminate synthase family protein [Pelagibacteraceae bacterium]|nr:N-acetylneuraminate synthase family protein [Pelagibacteraceae bacterium]
MLRKKELKTIPLIIAEVGQNHQGNLNLAKKYIKVFSALGANAIKFQTRNNKSLFSSGAYNKEYNNDNAFAKKYGHHREKLELSFKDLKILKNLCKKLKVKFMSTPFDEESVDLLKKIKVDLYKISSFDLGNLPLIKKVALSKIPVVISTGGGNLRQIKESVKILKKYKSDHAVLHCVSEYPCEYKRLGLEKIKKLSKMFPSSSIGLSDHFNGILSGPVAYLLGARVFEKHVTFNRAWKGTDHKFSMEPEGFRKFTRDIIRVSQMMKEKNKESIGKEAVFQKLGKSVVAKNNLKGGQKLKIDDISGKIFENQYTPIRDCYLLIGKRIKKNIKKNDLILKSDVV